MGLELKNCRATIKGASITGKLHVDSNQLEFRGGEIEWKLPVGKGTRAKVADGNLTVSRGTKSAIFAIGANAGKWAEKVRNPPSRVTKLGIKAEQRFFLKGKFDAPFPAEVQDAGLRQTRTIKSCDVAFVMLKAKSDLKSLDAVLKSSVAGVHTWAVWPKGVESIKQSDVMATAKAHGMGPGKGISFDDVHSAMRFTKK